MAHDARRAANFVPGARYIRIDQVEQVLLENLADEDAIPDGFTAADVLRSEVQELYADKIAAGHRAYRVVFHLLKEMAPR